MAEALFAEVQRVGRDRCGDLGDTWDNRGGNHGINVDWSSLFTGKHGRISSTVTFFGGIKVKLVDLTTLQHGGHQQYKMGIHMTMTYKLNDSLGLAKHWRLRGHRMGNQIWCFLQMLPMNWMCLRTGMNGVHCTPKITHRLMEKPVDFHMFH